MGSGLSNTINVQNGVRQGGVSSPVCNAVYVLTTLSSSKTECQIQVVDMGKWEYADNINLFSPSRTGL